MFNGGHLPPWDKARREEREWRNMLAGDSLLFRERRVREDEERQEKRRRRARATEFPPVVGAIVEFESAVEDGRLPATELGMFIAAKVTAIFPPPKKKPGRKPVLRGKGKGRTPRPVWKAAKTEAVQWLDDNGHPQPGDGGQADLERHIADWLAQRGHYPVESTIRMYVTRWIGEHWASLP
jgi:hypothetical protein